MTAYLVTTMVIFLVGGTCALKDSNGGGWPALITLVGNFVIAGWAIYLLVGGASCA